MPSYSQPCTLPILSASFCAVTDMILFGGWFGFFFVWNQTIEPKTTNCRTRPKQQHEQTPPNKL